MAAIGSQLDECIPARPCRGPESVAAVPMFAALIFAALIFAALIFAAASLRRGRRACNARAEVDERRRRLFRESDPARARAQLLRVPLGRSGQGQSPLGARHP